MATGRFDGKVAVVTGGASGLGRAIAGRVCDEGGRCVLFDVDGAALDAAVGELGADRAAGVAGDVTVEADVERAVQAAVDGFGALHLAANCAGVGTFSPITDHPVEEWDRVVDICLKGVFLSIKHEARAMRRGGGAILNIASINARQPGEGMAAYCSAKAAVEMLTRCAAMELGPAGIRVVGVGPGLVDTPLTAFTRDLPILADRYRDNSPLGRTGQPADVAAAATWLLSDEASWVSGDTLYIDGAALTREYPRFFDLVPDS